MNPSNPQDVQDRSREAAELEASEEQEHHGGGHFNRRLLYVFAGIVITAAVIGVHGIRSAGSRVSTTITRVDDAADAARDRAEDEELESAAIRPTPAAMPALHVATIPAERVQTPPALTNAEPLCTMGPGQIHARAGSATDGHGLSCRQHT